MTSGSQKMAVSLFFSLANPAQFSWKCVITIQNSMYIQQRTGAFFTLLAAVVRDVPSFRGFENIAQRMMMLWLIGALNYHDLATGYTYSPLSTIAWKNSAMLSRPRHKLKCAPRCALKCC